MLIELIQILEDRRRIVFLVVVVAAVATACGTATSPGSDEVSLRTVVPSVSGTTERRDGTRCSANALAIDAKTDLDSYRIGQRVEISVTARNLTRSTCTIATGPCLPQVVIADESGREVWNRAQNQVVCTVTDLHRLPKAEVFTQTVVWDGKLCSGRDPDSCSGRAVPAGRYWITAQWETVSQGVATFSVTP